MRNLTDVRGLLCCAIGEISGLGRSGVTPKAALKDLRSRLTEGSDDMPKKPPFMIFSGVVASAETNYSGKQVNTRCSHDYAAAFANFLTENDLGPVVHSSELQNRTTNIVMMYVWEPDYPKLEAWYLKNVPASASVELDLSSQPTAARPSNPTLGGSRTGRV